MSTKQHLAQNNDRNCHAQSGKPFKYQNQPLMILQTRHPIADGFPPACSTLPAFIEH